MTDHDHEASRPAFEALRTSKNYTRRPEDGKYWDAGLEFDWRKVWCAALTYAAQQAATKHPALERLVRSRCAHITTPYTLEEICAQIESDEYNAELLLQHLLLWCATQQAGEPHLTVLLRDYSEILAQLELSQAEEDRKFGDMGHRFFEQASTAIRDMEALIIDLTTHRPQDAAQQAPQTCVWTYDQDQDAYDADCGECWTLMNGGPEEIHYRFCPGCGRKVEVKTTEPTP